MRYIFICLFIFCNILISAQEKSLNKIAIIGTSHNGNKMMNGDSLLNIFLQIEPGIIFKEVVDYGKTPLYLYAANFFGFVKHSIEFTALQEYTKLYHDVKLYGYDIDFDNRYKYAKDLEKFDKDLRNQININYASNSTPDSIKQAIYEYVRPKNYVVRRLNDSSLYSINQLTVSDSLRYFSKIYNEIIMPIINKYPGFSLIKERANADFKLWEYRNKSMVDNLVKQIQEISTKSPIIILCGLFHKSYIEDLLKPQQDKYNFKLYDYWQLYKN